MRKTWQFIKERPYWAYLGLMLGTAAWAFVNEDAAAGWTVLGMGFIITAILWGLDAKVRDQPQDQPLTYEQAELSLIKRLGVEPVPIPGEAKPHDPEDCPLCRAIRDDFNKGAE
jgi:hypothetical protein